MDLRFDAEQNFTCQSCGECCRRAFDIVVSETEKERLEARDAARWFRESEDSEPGAASSPFEFAGSGLLRIRKRPDGVCGFLSERNQCRIHEELGGTAKPLTCQMFPFSFDAVTGETKVTASLCCPTIVRNEGRSVEAQAPQISVLARVWRKQNNPSDRSVLWTKEVPLESDLLESMRWVFRRILDLHEPTFSLRRNIRRLALLVEDWTRQRVVKLEPDKFEEYVNLTGEFAVSKPSDPPIQNPRLARLLFRGFFFASMVPLTSRSLKSTSGLRLRLRLLRLLLHVHGLGPAFHGLHFGKGRKGFLDVDSEPFFSPAYHALRAAIENLGSGRRPVVEELNLAVGHLLVAEYLFLARTNGTPDSMAWVRALMDAHDVAHADPESTFGRVLVSLSVPPSALHLFGGRAATLPSSA